MKPGRIPRPAEERRKTAGIPAPSVLRREVIVQHTARRSDPQRPFSPDSMGPAPHLPHLRRTCAAEHPSGHTARIGLLQAWLPGTHPHFSGRSGRIPEGGRDTSHERGSGCACGLPSPADNAWERSLCTEATALCGRNRAPRSFGRREKRQHAPEDGYVRMEHAENGAPQSHADTEEKETGASWTAMPQNLTQPHGVATSRVSLHDVSPSFPRRRFAHPGMERAIPGAPRAKFLPTGGNLPPDAAANKI